MAIPLLVLSPHNDFGSLIAQGLPQHEVYLTSDFSEAIQFVRKHDPTPPVLLDGDLDEIDISVLDIGLALRQIKSDVNLILVAREGQSTVRLKDLSLRSILIKPLSLSTLQTTLQNLNAQAGQPRVDLMASTDQELGWLQDVSRAARHLTRLMLESSAQAALITRQNELWAYAGQLKREAAQELARSVQKYWDTQSDIDLLRFIRLEATEAQHMLYARRLTASMVLALVFDAETPFSTIRAQAGQLVRSLSEVPADPTSQVYVGADLPDLNDDAEDLDNLPPISDLLGDVPPPQPPRQDRKARTMPWEKKVPPFKSAPVVSSPALYSAEFSRESSPVMRRSDHLPEADLLDTTRVSQVGAGRAEIPDDLAVTRVQKPSDPQSIMETRPQSVTEVAHRIVLEPASAAMYNLNYACLLVPRFENHHLTGDLASQLADWVSQACIAFGWRLEHISVRPEYLQWVVSVPPATAPGYIMRIIRQQTSDRVFKEFPRLKTDNPSGDFWAPGYLIMGGANPHPQKLVRDFIEQTRTRQGLRKEK